MTYGAKQRMTAVNSTELGAVMDKLVAVRLDLEPICRTSAVGPKIEATAEGIAEACNILHSAIDELRNIMRQLDGLTD